jgi:hypothetical protein
VEPADGVGVRVTMGNGVSVGDLSGARVGVGRLNGVRVGMGLRSGVGEGVSTGDADGDGRGVGEPPCCTGCEPAGARPDMKTSVTSEQAPPRDGACPVSTQTCRKSTPAGTGKSDAGTS